MLGLDFSEILIIGVVALVVVGPKELPQLLRTVGQWVAKARRMASEFQSQMNEAIREAELDDVKKHVDDLRSLSPKALIAEQLASVTQTFDEVKRETDAQFSSISDGLAETPATPVAEAAPSQAAASEAAAGEAVPNEAEVAARIDAAAGLPLDLAVPTFAEPQVAGLEAAPPQVAVSNVPAGDEGGAKPVEPKKEREA